MNYQQRDLVYVEQALPSGEVQKHPFLIISCRAASSKEAYHTAVMMTASSYTDQFTFKVEDDMFESPLRKQNCQLRLYILVSFAETKSKELVTRMKKVHFKNVVQQIKDYVLAVD